MSDPIPLLVTADEHRDGFKDIEVSLRDGTTRTLRLTAPSRAQVRGLGQRFAEGADLPEIVGLCLPQTPDAIRETQSLLDSLTPASGDLVEAVAFILAFGLEAEKKMSSLGSSLIRSMSSGPSSASSQPAGAGATSSAGAGPSSGSAPP